MQNSLWIQGQRLQFALCARLLDIAEKIENDDRRKQNILQYITNEQEADESDEEQALYTKNVLTELLIHFKFIKSTKNKPKRDLKVENQVKKALINSKNLTKLNFYVKGNFENDHKSAAAASSSSSDNLMYTPVMSDLHLLVLKEEGSLPRHPWANFLLAYRKLPSVISLKHAYTPIQTVHARTCTITFCYLSNPGESRPFVILKVSNM